jgi:hypothetical protein
MQWLERLWTREGAGIDKNAPPLTGLALFLNILKREWWEMVKLNILFLIASLPLVTMPAAMFAMTRVCVSFSNDENTYLLRDFLEALRKFAFRGTALAVLGALLVSAGAYTTVSYAGAARLQLVYSLPFAISLAVTLFLVLLCAYATVLMVRQDLQLLATVRQAALLALVRPLPMLSALGFVAALWFAHILLYPVSVFMPATINFSLGMFALCFAARNIVAKKHGRMPEPVGSGL